LYTIFSLFAVGDISCDVGGSIEFLQRTTTIDKPFFSWNPVTDIVTDEISDGTVAIMGIDILPTELSVESSKHFGDALVPLLEQLIATGYSTERADENLHPELVSDFVLTNVQMLYLFSYFRC
jgi:alpha-aminoadipic semialdehyde synthase